MKVEKAREKDGKLELLVELSVAETEEELQNAAMAVVARNGYGADRADYETPLERGQGCSRWHANTPEAPWAARRSA